MSDATTNAERARELLGCDAWDAEEQDDARDALRSLLRQVENHAHHVAENNAAAPTALTDAIASLSAAVNERDAVLSRAARSEAREAVLCFMGDEMVGVAARARSQLAARDAALAACAARIADLLQRLREEQTQKDRWLWAATCLERDRVRHLAQISALEAELDDEPPAQRPIETYVDDDGERCESCCIPMSRGCDAAEFTEDDGRGVIRRVVLHLGPCPKPDLWRIEWQLRRPSRWVGESGWLTARHPCPGVEIEEPYEDALTIARDLARDLVESGRCARVRLVRVLRSHPAKEPSHAR